MFIGCAISLCNFSPIQLRVVCNYGPTGNVGPDGLPSFAFPYAVQEIVCYMFFKKKCGYCKCPNNARPRYNLYRIIK